MTLSSRVPAVLDALLALWRAQLDETVTVTDGPQITDAALQRVVCVGWDGDDEGDGEAVTWTQAYRGLGAGVKDETITVTCVAICWNGGDTVRTARDDVYALFAEIEASVRDDTSLGLAPPSIAAITTGRLHQEANSDGVMARLPFTVEVQTRI